MIVAKEARQLADSGGRLARILEVISRGITYNATHLQKENKYRLTQGEWLSVSERQYIRAALECAGFTARFETIGEIDTSGKYPTWISISWALEETL
jgi:hypothetical protein